MGDRQARAAGVSDDGGPGQPGRGAALPSHDRIGPATGWLIAAALAEAVWLSFLCWMATRADTP